MEGTKMKKLISLLSLGCLLIGTGICANASHKHSYEVVGKTLVSVRVDPPHTYVISTMVDPITGEETNIYGTCNVQRRIYHGTWTCLVKENNVICGATLSDPYKYDTEYKHSSCGQ